MNFENGMTCEIMISNGTFTFGYVNGQPAEWLGNNEPLTVGVDFRLIKNEGSTIIFTKQNFGIMSKLVQNTNFHNVV